MGAPLKNLYFTRLANIDEEALLNELKLSYDSPRLSAGDCNQSRAEGDFKRVIDALSRRFGVTPDSFCRIWANN